MKVWWKGCHLGALSCRMQNKDIETLMTSIFLYSSSRCPGAHSSGKPQKGLLAAPPSKKAILEVSSWVAENVRKQYFSKPKQTATGLFQIYRPFANKLFIGDLAAISNPWWTHHCLRLYSWTSLG